MPTPWTDHAFDLPPPEAGAQGWAYCITGIRRRSYGPFPSEALARADRHARLRRWNRAARAHGGWAWRRTARAWVVTLPEGIACDGRPLDRAPCTTHAEPMASE